MGPIEEFGWHGNWGMAATAKENDYVHKLIGKIANEYNEHFVINYGIKTVNQWEINFSVDIGKLEFTGIDLLIIRLGENVQEDYAMNNNYYEALTKLIQRYKTGNTKVIITDNYWPSEYKDNVQKMVASDNNYYFVRINDLFGDPENSVFKQFQDPRINSHPSDKGMENIAARIFECIKNNEIINRRFKTEERIDALKNPIKRPVF
jgi:hypothetical protein